MIVSFKVLFNLLVWALISNKYYILTADGIELGDESRHFGEVPVYVPWLVLYDVVTDVTRVRVIVPCNPH